MCCQTSLRIIRKSLDFYCLPVKRKFAKLTEFSLHLCLSVLPFRKLQWCVLCETCFQLNNSLDSIQSQNNLAMIDLITRLSHCFIHQAPMRSHWFNYMILKLTVRRKPLLINGINSNRSVKSKLYAALGHRRIPTLLVHRSLELIACYHFSKSLFELLASLFLLLEATFVDFSCRN